MKKDDKGVHMYYPLDAASLLSVDALDISPCNIYILYYIYNVYYSMIYMIFWVLWGFWCGCANSDEDVEVFPH